MTFCNLQRMSRVPKSVFTNDEAKQIGLCRQRLASLANAGEVVRLSRGVYAPRNLAEFSHPEMVVLFKKGTDCVIALESALVLHGFTTATPHALWIAIRRGSRKPATDFPIEVLRVSDSAYENGVKTCLVDNIPVRVYSAAKTVADLFKFRSRTGLSLALEALREGLRKRLFSVDELMAAAKTDRVQNVIMPYVEGMLG